MGHRHSAYSHKRLRSISNAKNCGEFTEVVEFEFSDSSVFMEPSRKTSLDIPSKSSEKSPTRDTKTKLNIIPEESKKASTPQIKYPKDLLLLEEHVDELAKNIENMSPDEFFVYFPTLKDDLHNCWQKVYDVKEPNVETKIKKYKVIDHIKSLLKTLNIKLQSRHFERQY
ncbi:hypothetical protein ABEB36_005103 [Hypothenemus hampei]|uniref:Uncharacterized protein n=1 Tax=Hypothenemus hampei TaxID=57062 RepID=A0ABD1EX06_HYPHA